MESQPQNPHDIRYCPCQQTILDHHQAATEMPSECHFAGGPIVAPFYMLTETVIYRLVLANIDSF